MTLMTINFFNVAIYCHVYYAKIGLHPKNIDLGCADIRTGCPFWGGVCVNLDRCFDLDVI